MELEKAKKQIFDLKAELFKWQYTNIANILDRPPPSAYTPIATPNLTQPTQPASLLGLLEGVNRGVAPNITGPSPAGPTNETPTQTNKTLPNPYTSTTTTTQPTNTLPFNNSNPNPPPPTQQNSTTAITLPAPPSASSPTPNSITSSGRRTSENNGTPTPSTPSNQQTITRGCGQGTANSRCRSPPTQQDTTTNLALPQTTSGLNLYEYGHVEAGKVGQHSIYEMFTAPPISKRLQDT
jgi:hypothetical protein